MTAPTETVAVPEHEWRDTKRLLRAYRRLTTVLWLLCVALTVALGGFVAWHTGLWLRAVAG